MIWRALIAVAVVGGSMLSAQTATGLRVLAQTATGVTFVSENGTIPIPSDGRQTTAQFTVSNANSANLTINQITVSGADMGLAAIPTLPVVISSNGSTSFAVRYTPSLKSSSGIVSIQFTENSQNKTFSFTVAGTLPEYQFSLISSTGASGTISPGAKIIFPSSKINTSQTATLVVTNSGTAAGVLNSSAVTGTRFAVSPSGTVSIPAGQNTSLQISFSPVERGLQSGTLSLSLGSQIVMFNLEGLGTAPDFLLGYSLRTDGNARPLTNRGRLTFAPTAAQTTAIADVIVTNQGNASGQVKTITLGGASFDLFGLPLLPATLNPNQAITFSVRFSPKQLGSSAGVLRVDLEDGSVEVTVEGTTSPPTFALSYIDPNSNNIVQLGEGLILPFANTQVNTNASITVILRNSGEGTGYLNNLSVSGEGFQVAELPSLPATIAPKTELRFTVRFSPKQRQRYTGQIRADFGDSAITINLLGSGVSPTFSYDLISETENPLLPSSEIQMESAVGQKSSLKVRVRNSGDLSTQITAISVSGAGFDLSNVPFLPVALGIEESQTFTVDFTPTQPGVSRGRLRVGNDSFELVGNGRGSRLTFAYSNSAGLTTVNENGIIILNPARVGETARAEVTVQNTGTTPLSLATIDISPGGGVFSIEGSPLLPLSLGPAGEIRFAVVFTPNNTGNVNATLRVNNSNFTLSGNGRQPVSLPAFRIEGPSGTQAAMLQTTYRLRLVNPYSLPLRGTLSLSFFSEVFASNPAVQFASGGRTANFSIPANSTTAVFENGSQDIRIQTGSVAGTISLSPTFATAAGLDLTPESVTPLTLSVERAAPRLLSVDVGSRTNTSITLLISGFSTTRSLRQIDIDMAPRNGEQFTATKLSLNVESAAILWFESAQAQATGGLFSAAVPVNLQRNGSTTEDLFRFVQSFTVTARNDIGASNTVTIALP